MQMDDRAWTEQSDSVRATDESVNLKNWPDAGNEIPRPAPLNVPAAPRRLLRPLSVLRRWSEA